MRLQVCTHKGEGVWVAVCGVLSHPALGRSAAEVSGLLARGGEHLTQSKTSKTLFPATRPTFL